VELTRLAIEHRDEECRAAIETAYPNLSGFRDPCALYYSGRFMARVGDVPRALATLTRAVQGGFGCSDFMEQDPWLDSLRGQAAFDELLRHATRLRDEAAAAFLDAGGDRVLGLDPSSLRTERQPR
jgi:hypothetical protein